MLRERGSERNRAGMARYGIVVDMAFGVPMPVLRGLAKELKSCDRSQREAVAEQNHELAIALWETGYHEARILASLLADPQRFTREQMYGWAAEYCSWDLCDQCCGNLFARLPFAYDTIEELVRDERTFVRRTAFALMAELAVKDKRAPDERFRPMFALIESYATDERNFVRKAVNWALRQIGKRNRRLWPEAKVVAQRLAGSTDRTARWIGKDALRELESPSIIARIKE